jgi:hypothetical protein
MESVEEQIEYGNHCGPHGNPVGTPGGADIMCQLCEDGLTTWVEDPSWSLRLGPLGQYTIFNGFRFRESELASPSIRTLRRYIKFRRFLMMFGTEDEALKPFSYEMIKNNEGYWTDA